jgi:hypothetical protein
LEVARALQNLIDGGDLAPPRRSIRFLWLPEMTGSFAYLSAYENRIPQMVVGLNLDMVGQDQEQCGSSLLFEQAPGALANFTAPLLEHLRRYILPEIRSFGKTGGYPLFRYADIPFSGGSDHYIFSAPSVGVPMPMIIQWPDRYYHTSADTPDRVDPRMMGYVGMVTGTYAYWLAQAGVGEAKWLVREMSARFRRQVIAEVQTAVTEAGGDNSVGREALLARLEYLLDQQQRALETVRRLSPIDVSAWRVGAERFLRTEWGEAAEFLPDLPVPEVPGRTELDRVPTLRFRGPVQANDIVARQDESVRDRWYELMRKVGELSRTLPDLAGYWANGQRTLGEIAGLVFQESGHEASDLLTDYFNFLADLGLVDVRQRPGRSGIL